MHGFFFFFFSSVCMCLPSKSWSFLCFAISCYMIFHFDFFFFFFRFARFYWTIDNKSARFSLRMLYTSVYHRMLSHYTQESKYSHGCHLKAFAKEKLHPSFVTNIVVRVYHRLEGIFHFLSFARLVFIENWLPCFSHISLNVMLDYMEFFLFLL